MELELEKLRINVVELNRNGFFYAVKESELHSEKKRKILLLENKIRSFQPESSENPQSYERNEYVSAFVKTWRKWCRGIVRDVINPNSTYRVFLLDYGECFVVEKNDLKILPSFASIHKEAPLVFKIAQHGVVSSHLKVQMIHEPKKQGAYWFLDDMNHITNVLQGYSKIAFKSVVSLDDFQFGIIYLIGKFGEYEKLQDVLIKNGVAVKKRKFAAIMADMVSTFRKSRNNIDFNIVNVVPEDAAEIAGKSDSDGDKFSGSTSSYSSKSESSAKSEADKLTCQSNISFKGNDRANKVISDSGENIKTTIDEACIKSLKELFLAETPPSAATSNKSNSNFNIENTRTFEKTNTLTFEGTNVNTENVSQGFETTRSNETPISGASTFQAENFVNENLLSLNNYGSYEPVSVVNQFLDLQLENHRKEIKLFSEFVENVLTKLSYNNAKLTQEKINTILYEAVLNEQNSRMFQ